MWLLILFLIPFYVILSVAFGALDPIFLTPTPVFDPLKWQFGSFTHVVGQVLTPGSIYASAFVRTIAYVAVATALSLAIGYPVAYFMARHAGRFKMVFLVAFVAPDAADAALAALRAVPGCEQAAEIGEVKTEPPGMVLVETSFGGKRVMDQLVGDPLPRIC